MGRVLVTGATGFLGAHVARTLSERGVAVIATGRDSARAPAIDAPGFTFIPADLAKPADIVRLARDAGDFDAVVHCAGLSSPWGTEAAFETANVSATRNLVALTAGRTRRMVHISTPSVYFRFRDQCNVAEDEPLPPPVNRYAASKRRGEDEVREANLDSFILRPRGLYGAGDTALLPRLIRAAKQRPLLLMRGGHAVTDLTHVSDVVEAILAALAAPVGASGTYNISGGEPVPLRDIIDRACRRVGVEPRWRPVPVAMALAGAKLAEWSCGLLPGRPEPAVTAYALGLLAFSQTLDIGAARRALDWSPTIDFATGLDLTFGGARDGG